MANARETAERDLDQATEEITRLVYELTRRWDAYLNRKVREMDVGLTGTQAVGLWMLKEPLPMSEFASALGCDRASATGIADRLEAKGLVTREPDPVDRRGRRVQLTPEGRVLRRRMQRRVIEARPSLLGLDEDEKRVLRDLLRKAMAGI